MEKADTIYHNAIIHTVDKDFSIKSALVIKDGRILDIGDDQSMLEKYKSDKVYDLNQKHVYPGFIDAHCHFYGYGLSLSKVNLVGTQSWQEVIEKTKAFATSNPELSWITGRGWDQNDWDVKAFPDHTELTKAFPNTPVFIRRIDGHAGIANRKAMEIAGIDAASSKTGGQVFLDDSGAPTGLFIDNAMYLIEKAIPNPSPEEMERALLKAQANCFAVGLTGVHDAGLSTTVVEQISSLHEKGSLKMNVYAMLQPRDDSLLSYMQRGPILTDRLSVRSVKVYADGALGSRGAWLLEEYADDPGNTGLSTTDLAFVDRTAALCAQYGFQVNTHCIGDRANREILNIYQKYIGADKDHRWRIEHAQVVEVSDQKRIGDLGVLPSVQPTHATSDMYWAEDRLGSERVKTAYAFKDLLEQSGVLPLGSDFPVEGINPIRGYYAAVFRKDAEGYPNGGYQMENALSREEALRGTSSWAAFSGFQEKELGSLEIGKWADLVVSNTDLLKATEKEILHFKVEQTIVHGEVVYSNK